MGQYGVTPQSNRSSALRRPNRPYRRAALRLVVARTGSTSPTSAPGLGRRELLLPHSGAMGCASVAVLRGAGNGSAPEDGVRMGDLPERSLSGPQTSGSA